MELLGTLLTIIVGLVLIGLWLHASEKHEKDSDAIAQFILYLWIIFIVGGVILTPIWLIFG